MTLRGSEVCGSLLISALLFCSSAAQAQVVPDGTIPTAVSQTGNAFTITNGARAGNNLFHSFSQFSVPTGGSAFFNNAVDVQNIISRVTGGNLSTIDGLIQSNGTANLFLMNPSGISFGPNARLQLGGSFFATTANSIKFADGTEFSATNPQASPLLTITAPIGLQFGANPRAIALQGASLTVPTGKTLALAGGSITLTDGSLAAPTGRIEVGAVGGNQSLGLNPTGQGWILDYSQVNQFQNVQMSNQNLTTSGEGGGGIQVQGNQVTLSNNSSLTADTLGSQNGLGILIRSNQFTLDRSTVSSSNSDSSSGQGGNLTISASDSIHLTGAANTDISDFFNQLYSGGYLTYQPGLFHNGLFAVNYGTASGGNISLNTRELTVKVGAIIATSPFATGQGGNVTVNASNAATLDAGVISTQTYGVGDGGNITINTRQLVLQNLSAATTSTLAEGQAGNLLVNAADSVEILGSPSVDFNNSPGLYANTSPVANNGLFIPTYAEALVAKSGNSGNITVNTRRLRLTDGGEIASATYGPANGGTITVNATQSVELFGASPNAFQFPSTIYAVTTASGNAGKIVVNTRQLTLRDGGVISAGASGNGSGGSILINATESLTLAGSVAAPQVSIDSGFYAFGDRFPSAVVTTSLQTGAAGDLTISTGQLTVLDGAMLAVSGQGSGDAGNLSITAARVSLQNQAVITAETASGEGGNINLRVQDYLLLRNGSQITATAGGTGNGGNITLNTPFIVAVSSENSDIIANAVRGRGGNIQITSNSIFGITPRPQLTPQSDITASSQFGIDGTTNLTILSLTPTTGVETLPTALIDPNQQIAQGCSQIGDSRFVVTGRGGLPENPTERSNSRLIWADTREFSPGSPGTITPQASQPQDMPEMVEATGWRRSAAGEIELYAAVPQEVKPKRTATCAATQE